MVKVVLALVGFVVAAVLVFLGVATLTEYRPEAVERVHVDVLSRKTTALQPGDKVSFLTFNIGYAGLGKDQDFFMDGGQMVRPSEEEVQTNLDGIIGVVESNPAQVVFLQEVDTDSHRSYSIDQQSHFDELGYANSAFAYNFRSMFTPYPIPPIGKVASGLQTLTNLEVRQAQRHALTVPLGWPVRLFNLKRCLLVERLPVGEEAELVLINFHLEAYESGEGRAQQLKELISVMQAEYKKGNYVIAGGDFNHNLPGVKFPVVDTTWEPGKIKQSDLPKGYNIANDPTEPTSRLNNHPLTGDLAETQLFGIDGFITSPNVVVENVQTLGQGFVYSDHNPVRMVARLLEDE